MRPYRGSAARRRFKIPSFGISSRHGQETAASNASPELDARNFERKDRAAARIGVMKPQRMARVARLALVLRQCRRSQVATPLPTASCRIDG